MASDNAKYHSDVKTGNLSVNPLQSYFKVSSANYLKWANAWLQYTSFP